MILRYIMHNAYAKLLIAVHSRFIINPTQQTSFIILNDKEMVLLNDRWYLAINSPPECAIVAFQLNIDNSVCCCEEEIVLVAEQLFVVFVLHFQWDILICCFYSHIYFFIVFVSSCGLACNRCINFVDFTLDRMSNYYSNDKSYSIFFLFTCRLTMNWEPTCRTTAQNTKDQLEYRPWEL